MSSLEFRASSPQDALAIAELCRRMLDVGEASPMFEPSLMHWKYWRPWPGWQGARSFVITRDTELLAHVAALPVSFLSQGSMLTLLHPLDWVARTEVVGVGAMLLSRLSKLADGMMVVGGSVMTQRMLVPLGFRELPPVRRFAARPSGSLPGELDTEPLAGTEAPPALATVFSPLLVAARSVALTQAWGACPAITLHGYQVACGGQARGGFQLGIAPGQARLLDTWCTSPSPLEWAHVLRAARLAAHRLPEVAEVVALANTAIERQALLEAGFSECGELPMFVRSRPPIPQGGGLRFQLLDGDAAFLHHGIAESWLDAG